MNNKIPYIIGASTLALLLLILIQVKWMDQSRRLIEDQFDQKVDMALCRAVDDFVDILDHRESALIQTCKKPGPEGQDFCSDKVNSFISSKNIKKDITEALSFYGINMPYELTVKEKKLPNCNVGCKAGDKNYTCSLFPVIETDELELSINFPGKQAYVLKQMGLMLALSIIIMLFITSVFIYANFYLLKQKRISERNREYFNNMAHEFKTPLTNIGLASKMLGKKTDDPLIHIIKSENDQLSEQVSRVLTMATLDSGQFEIAKERVCLRKLIDSAIKSMEIQLADRKGSISMQGIAENIQIVADPFHIANAFKNILENAIKYNEKVPEINIKGIIVGDMIQISIQDNGIGISKKDQALVFEKFYRIQNSDSYQNKGFGLGLSYVKKIINLHNGDIKVFSEWQKGTRFDLKIPKAAI